MAPDSSILAWRIPWTEEPGGLQSMGLQESDTTEHKPKEGIAARNLVSNSDSVFYILYSQSSCIPEPRREPHDSYNTLTSSWKTGLSPQRSWRGKKKCCFLNFYCWFEGLPLLISWAIQAVLVPKGEMETKEDQSPGPFRYINHSANANNYLFIQVVSRRKECSFCHGWHLSII